MTDEPQELEHRERKRFGPGCAFIAVFSLLVLYFLSPIIVIWFLGLEVLDNAVFLAVFAPLIWLDENVEFVGDIYAWLTGWFL